MAKRIIPEWFSRAEEAFDPVHMRIAEATKSNHLPPHLSLAPQEAAYFFMHAMEIASEANKAGIHANALSQTRYCIEALAIIELGMCRVNGREKVLEDWLKGKVTPGKIRQWLAKEAWPSYGTGLWSESWEDFIAKLAGVVQPYAHYTSQLAQWQSRLHFADPEKKYGIYSKWTDCLRSSKGYSNNLVSHDTELRSRTYLAFKFNL